MIGNLICKKIIMFYDPVLLLMEKIAMRKKNLSISGDQNTNEKKEILSHHD